MGGSSLRYDLRIFAGSEELETMWEFHKLTMGASQTALIILNHEKGLEFALRNYQKFDEAIIAELEMKKINFLISSQKIERWISEHGIV